MVVTTCDTLCSRGIDAIEIGTLHRKNVRSPSSTDSMMTGASNIEQASVTNRSNAA